MYTRAEILNPQLLAETTSAGEFLRASHSVSVHRERNHSRRANYWAVTGSGEALIAWATVRLDKP